MQKQASMIYMNRNQEKEIKNCIKSSHFPDCNHFTTVSVTEISQKKDYSSFVVHDSLICIDKLKKFQ